MTSDIEDRNVCLLTESTAVLSRWTEHCKDYYFQLNRHSYPSKQSDWNQRICIPTRPMGRGQKSSTQYKKEKYHLALTSSSHLRCSRRVSMKGSHCSWPKSLGKPKNGQTMDGVTSHIACQRIGK